jgi:two-component system LytT family response regulator
MSNSVTAIIIDDEVSARNTLKKFLSVYCPEVSIIAECGSVKEAMASIKKHDPEIVFLDIHLPDGDGFDVLHQLSEINFEIIFTTGFDNYAIKAIKYSAIDYLLKPLVAEELTVAVKRAIEKISENNSIPAPPKPANHLNPMTRIAVPDAQGLKIIHLTKIVYCKAEGNYTSFVLSDQSKMLICKTLKEYEAGLPEPPFFRTHNSFLINLEHVKTYVKGRGGQVEMSNGEFLDVARNRKQHLLDRLTRGSY